MTSAACGCITHHRLRLRLHLHLHLRALIY